MRLAAMVIESGYVDWETFDPSVLTPEVLEAFDPTVSFNVVDSTAAATAPTADAGLGEVDYYGTADTYAVGSRSESDKTFGMMVDKSSGWVVTFYLDGQPFDWASSESATSTEPVRTVASAAKYGETIDAWSIEMTVLAPELLGTVEEVAGIVGNDEEVWVVQVTIKNNADSDCPYGIGWWDGEDGEGVTYDASDYVKDEALGSGDVPVGQTVKGYVGFDLPNGAALVSVNYRPPYMGSPAYVTWGQ